jgi:putative FmdB family regulatory protein
MPLYEYRCEGCGRTEEKLEGMSAPATHDCPACGAPGGMHRQISRTSFNLAGGGWYTQGYDKGGYDKGGSAKAAGAPDAAPSGGCPGGGCACHGARSSH